MRNPFLETVLTSNFAKLWLSQILSQLALNFLNFVLILRIFESTGSTVAVSLVWIFYAIPAVIFGPFVGTIVDFVSRRKILILTNFLQGLIVLFYLPITRSIWPIYTIVFLYSLVNQLFIPAEAATLPSLIPKRLLAAANSLFLFTIYSAFLIGSALAGPAVQTFGRRTPFVLAASMLMVASATVYFLPRQGRVSKGIRPGLFFSRLVEGYRFLRNNPIVLVPLILLVVAQIIMAILAVSAPALTVNVLKIPLVAASLQLIAPVGIGALTGVVMVVRLLRLVRKKFIVSSGFILSSLVFAFFSLVIPQMEMGRSLWGSTMAFLLGVAFVSIIIPLQTLLQEKIPENLRGRVFGVLSFLITVAALIPVLFAATLAEIFGELTILGLLSIALLTLGIAALKSEDFLEHPFFKTA